MNILYIDTSSSYLYTGIVCNGKLLASIKKKFDKEMSKYAVAEIKKMFDSTNLKPGNIDKIIVVNGPGSFTGIRIGMTFAKVFAFSLKKEITVISSLEAMGISINSDELLVPVINARRGYVYAGIYKNGVSIFDNQYINFDNLLEKLGELQEKYTFIVGDDTSEYYHGEKYDPDILRIVNFFEKRKPINPHLVEPNYLKLTEAEENLGSILYDSGN